MIASISGEVLVRRPDHVVIDAMGVGYRLAISAETLRAVPATGKHAVLHAHLIARDDSLALYGFATEEERDLFLALIGVSGVGPKVALAALSHGPPRELRAAIAAGDSKRFQAVPGIGKRTAERIIVELRERVADALEADAAPGGGAGSRIGPPDAHAEARDGLLGLGYSATEAERLLLAAEGESAEELIGSALRAAARPTGVSARAPAPTGAPRRLDR